MSPFWLFIIATYSFGLALILALLEHYRQSRQSRLDKCDKFCEELSRLAVRHWSSDTTDENLMEMGTMAYQIQQYVSSIIITLAEKLRVPAITKAAGQLSVITAGSFGTRGKKADLQAANKSIAAINALRVELLRAF